MFEKFSKETSCAFIVGSIVHGYIDGFTCDKCALNSHVNSYYNSENFGEHCDNSYLLFYEPVYHGYNAYYFAPCMSNANIKYTYYYNWDYSGVFTFTTFDSG